MSTPLGLAGALLIDPRDADAPSLDDMRSSWSIVIADRGAGVVCPISVGYLGRDVARDDRSLIVGDPFDYQASWAVVANGKGITRAIDIMPCEGFTLSTIRIDRWLTIIDCKELTHGALELVHTKLVSAMKMRRHFREAGSSISKA